jgi:hypothetical protein
MAAHLHFVDRAGRENKCLIGSQPAPNRARFFNSCPPIVRVRRGFAQPPIVLRSNVKFFMHNPEELSIQTTYNSAGRVCHECKPGLLTARTWTMSRLVDIHKNSCWQKCKQSAVTSERLSLDGALFILMPIFYDRLRMGKSPPGMQGASRRPVQPGLHVPTQ